MNGKMPSIRYLAAAVLLVAAGVVAYFAVADYRQQASLSLGAPRPGKAGDKTALSADQLAALFTRQEATPGRYRIIEESNLFSKSRTPWTPPPEEPKTQAAEQAEAAPATPAKRDDVLLEGTFSGGGAKYALISFPTLRLERDPVLVSEGQTVTNEELPQAQKFTLHKIEGDTVTLSDASGQKFLVALYEQKSGKQRRSGGAISTSARPAAPQVQVSASSASSSGSQSGPTSQVVTSPKKNGGSDTNGTITMDQLQTMSQDEKERLAKEGKLTRFNTPMGVYYRPKQ